MSQRDGFPVDLDPSQDWETTPRSPGVSPKAAGARAAFQDHNPSGEVRWREVSDNNWRAKWTLNTLSMFPQVANDFNEVAKGLYSPQSFLEAQISPATAFVLSHNWKAYLTLYHSPEKDTHLSPIMLGTTPIDNELRSSRGMFYISICPSWKYIKADLSFSHVSQVAHVKDLPDFAIRAILLPRAY